MGQKSLKIFSYICGLFSIAIGTFYLFWWYHTKEAFNMTIGISYSNSIAFILIGFCLFLLHKPIKLPLLNILGLSICVISLAKLTHSLFGQNTFLTKYSFFLSHVNPFNTLGLGLLGTSFLIWQSKTKQWQYWYGFFVAFTSIGLSTLGLIIHTFGLHTFYGNTHLFSVITLELVSLGFIASLIYFERSQKVCLCSWIPFVITITILNLVLFLGFGLYLNEQAFEKFTPLLIAYAVIFGILFALFAGLVVYFWLTNRTQAKEIRIAKEKEQLSLEAAGVGTWRWDISNDRIQWDDEAHRIFGLRRGSFSEKSEDFLSLIHPEDREQLKNDLEKSLKYKTLHDMEFRVIWPDNSIHFLHGKGNTLVERGKGPTIMAGIVTDITESVKAKKALAKAEEKFHAFVESTEDWIWEMDQNGFFLYSNPAVKKILGYFPEEIVGQSIYFFILEKDKMSVQKEIENAVRSKSGWYHRLLTWKDKSGKEHILESTSLPILNETQQFVGFRGVDRDVTEIKYIEKTKNEFISMINHEIRTPLTSIHGALGLLSIEPNLLPKTKELIELAYHNSKLLSELINDIMDIEKIELGKFDLKFDRVTLKEIIQETIRSIQMIANKRNIKIVEESIIPEIEVNGDRERLTQVLLNLLSNAIKFSKEDSRIFISMEMHEDNVRVLIRDEGQGIPKEFYPKVFSRFERADNSTTRAQKGTGLGLNISKTIIEQMHGHMGFSSEEGKGSTFYFELPIIKRMAA